MEFTDKYSSPSNPDVKKIEISQDAYAIGESVHALIKVIEKARRSLFK